jgi:sulfur relay protein TusB/DsrH
MLVLIKSSPHTSEGKRGLKIARDTSSDIVLLQDGVYFMINDMLDGFCGTAYAVKEDVALRGLSDVIRGVKIIDWDDLIDKMVEEDKVVGMF